MEAILINSPIKEASWQRTIKKQKLPDEIVNLVLDAYEKGKKEGFKEALGFEKKAIIDAFEKNLQQAMSISVQLHKTLTSGFNIDLKGLYLKIENKTVFKVALVLPISAYYDKIIKRKITEQLIDIELNKKTDTFQILFTTLAHSETLNLKKLFLDGYIFHYVENQRKPEA